MSVTFRFVDIFAGIGGFRIALEAAGGRCVFSAERDRFAQDTYEAFFGERPVFNQPDTSLLPGDITSIPPNSIADHEFLAAGFPCQPFSLAGVSKKRSMGRAHGFDDETQGTLFFSLKEIIQAKKPELFLLENVKNIRSHDNGRTMRVILQSLDEIGYEVTSAVIDAIHWTPQHRERTYFAGFRRPEVGSAQRWIVRAQDFSLQSIRPEAVPTRLECILENDVDPKYTLGPGTWSTLRRHRQHHASIGQGFGHGLIKQPFDGKTTRTLSARYYKDGAEILIDRGPRRRPRRLTPLECCRLMGFPEKYQRFFDRNNREYPQPVSDTQAYRQFGNSVCVPAVTDIVSSMLFTLERAKEKSDAVSTVSAVG